MICNFYETKIRFFTDDAFEPGNDTSECPEVISTEIEIFKDAIYEDGVPTADVYFAIKKMFFSFDDMNIEGNFITPILEDDKYTISEDLQKPKHDENHDQLVTY